jgi:VanZ family protein
MNKATRPVVGRWVPVIVWMVLIFFGSTDVLSAEHTSRFLVPFLRWLDPQISWNAIRQIHFAVRKLGHLTEYAILAALLWRALRVSLIGTRWKAAGLAFLFAVGYAFFDEFHQSFIPSRTSSIDDVAIDTCGALCAIAICLLFAQRRVGEVTPTA